MRWTTIAGSMKSSATARPSSSRCSRRSPIPSPEAEALVMYTASTALLEALGEWGVSFIFANFGSDHPGLIEAIAEGQAAGRPMPQVITCPNEMVALSAAHGYAQVSGRAQAVIVH